MTTSRRKIATNIFFLASSQGLTWSITLVYMVLVPRYLGPTGTGTLSIAWAASQIMVVIASFGTTKYIVREVARDHQSATNLVGPAAFICGMVGLLGWAILFLIFNFINVSSELTIVLLIVATSSILNLVGVPFGSTLIALEKMHYSFFSSILQKGISVSLAIIFVTLGLNVVWIALAELIASIPVFLLNLYWFNKHSKTTFKPDFSKMRSVLKAGMSFYIMDITFQIYLYLDGLLLSVMTSETVVGYYSVPVRLFGTLLFIPVIISSAILPALCRMAQENPDEQKVMTRNTMSVLAALSLPIAAGTTVIASQLINLLYGAKFASSVSVLILLAWTIIPTYQGIAIYQSMVAQDRQGIWVKVNVAAAAANLFLNLIAINLTQNLWGNGAIGAAGAQLVSELVILVIGFRLVGKGTLSKAFWISTSKSALATGIMTLAILPLMDVFILVPIIVGAVVYIVVALALGIVPKPYLRLAISLPKRYLLKKRTQEAGVIIQK